MSNSSLALRALETFGELDDLAQVIYQGFERFVLLSRVSARTWTIHLGLVGEGRWWAGSWSGNDILQIAGSDTSDQALEAFASRLADVVRGGEVHIARKDAQITLTIGAAKELPLAELSGQDALAFTTSVVHEIAKEAQSRRCQLHPSATTPVQRAPIAVSKPLVPPSQADAPARPAASRATAASAAPGATASSVTTLRTAVPSSSRASTSSSIPAKASSTPHSSIKPKPSQRPTTGASLANPNKKARTYQAIEFGSDDDDD